jgi:HK97 family phage major capsid protein
MTLAEILAALKVVRDKMTAINTVADGRALTDDEQTQWDAAKTEAESLKQQAERAEALEADEKWASQSRGVQAGQNDDDGDDSGQMHRSASAGEPNRRKDPMRGFQTPREFITAIVRQGDKFHDCRDERLADLWDPAAGRSDKRSVRAAGSDEAGEYSDPYGGFLVPEGFLPSLLKIGVEADPMAARVTRIPMELPSVKINARVDKDHSSSVSGGFTVARNVETQTPTATRAQFEQIELNADTLMGLGYATEELLSDSPSSFAAIIEAGFRDEFTNRLIDERLNGTGVGQFMGVMNSPCLITVSAEAGQSADTLLYLNLVKMRARCWNYSNAIWITNHNCLPQLMTMVLAVGTGGVPAWQMNAVDGQPDTLFGRPVIMSEYAAALGDLGDIVLGDWSQYLEGTLQNVQGAESIHVRFLNNERTFRFSMRNAAAPWWRTAMTPKRGSTLSPFVTLAAR